MRSLLALAAVVHVTVAPATSLSDAPVTIAASGLRPHSTVTLSLSSTDAAGVRWRSTDTVRTTAGGTIRVSGGPLIHGLRPTGGLAVYAWHRANAQTFIVRVAGSSASFKRRLYAQPLATTQLTLASAGFVGTFVTPKNARHHAAVLAFGGSEGGLSGNILSVAEHLAAHGYPTLAIAYFAAPGLPQFLDKIPLEYFTRALAWLGARPQVAPHRLTVLGVSRGSEAAELLGANFPELVHSVVAVVPSNVVHGTAWTIGGAPVPYTNESNEPQPTDNPAAVIPVESIRGPLFAACAFDDDVWPSCQYASAMILRLRAKQHAYHDVLVAAPTAKHALGHLVPFTITSAPPPDGDEAGYELVWPKLVAFLKAASA